MGIEKIRNVTIGDDVPINTVGSYNGKAYINGELLQADDLYFVNSRSLRYIMQLDDVVIGRITHKTMDCYKVELGQGITGFLPVLNFPNATKRNKPELNVDEYVMCKITKLNDYPLLLCEEGMGKIDGYVFELNCYSVRKLLSGDILKVLGETYNYKIGVGLNGRIWIYNENVEIVKEIYEQIRMETKIDTEWI